MSYIIALSNEKGGVAKTTTSLSLGSALANMDYRVLLVDLDSQADLTLSVGLYPDKIPFASIDIFNPGITKTLKVVNLCLPTAVTNLDIVPSNGDMFLLEQKLPSLSKSPLTLRQSLKPIFPLPYDYIIIDCPPALGPVTINALAAADLLIIPTQAEYFSAHSLGKMMSLIRYIRKEPNPALAYRILVTLLDRRNRVHNDVLNHIQGVFGETLFETRIEIDTKIRDSQSEGIPLIKYIPSTRGSIQYMSLAQELLAYVEKAQHRTARNALR
jgi:chromosome partitioning protein